jgi:hypothetical protein
LCDDHSKHPNVYGVLASSASTDSQNNTHSLSMQSFGSESQYSDITNNTARDSDCKTQKGADSVVTDVFGDEKHIDLRGPSLAQRMNLWVHTEKAV